MTLIDGIWMDRYLAPPVSNGNPIEQSLIRRWWHESQGARGLLVWEYGIEDRYIDAVWFPGREPSGTEAPGRNVAALYPLAGETVVVCEAKVQLNPELIGQALVYRQFALHASAQVKEVIVFARTATTSMLRVARELGLRTEVQQAPGGVFTG